jgi:hypothetical protein
LDAHQEQGVSPVAVDDLGLQPPQHSELRPRIPRIHRQRQQAEKQPRKQPDAQRSFRFQDASMIIGRGNRLRRAASILE